MMKKRICIVVSLVFIILVLFQYVPFRIFIRNYNIGGGYWLEDQDKVQYYCPFTVYNISMRSGIVELELSSNKDVQLGFLSDSQLQVDKVQVKEGPATIIDETCIYLPPLSVSRLEVECSGEYGGTGSMVRHPPESIKLKYIQH